MNVGDRTLAPRRGYITKIRTDGFVHIRPDRPLPWRYPLRPDDQCEEFHRSKVIVAENENIELCPVCGLWKTKREDCDVCPLLP